MENRCDDYQKAVLTISGKEAAVVDCSSKENRCIECHVSQCANHSTCGEYCALDRITVGTHEANPSMDQCTDCMSFRKK